MTDNQKELFPMVNEKDEVIGKITRSEAHKNPDIIHRVAVVLVYNDKGELFLQKRNATKDIFPNHWDISVAGHVNYGDDYITTAVRELSEEFGIVVSPNLLTPLEKKLIRTSWESEFWQIYKLTLPPKTEIVFSKEEISEITSVDEGKLKMMLEDKNIDWNSKTRKLLQEIKVF